MQDLPVGVVSFLFTDIEGSTRLLERHPDAYRTALSEHHAILAEAVAAEGGRIFHLTGDGVCAAFASPRAAVAAALAAQRRLQGRGWGEIDRLAVRMAVHTGEVELSDGEYFGAALHRCARLMSAAAGGQVLLSGLTGGLVREQLGEAASLRDLGEHRLRDLTQPERLCQLVHPALWQDFPPPRTLGAQRPALPIPPTPLFGRDAEVAGLRARLGDPGERLVTLIGPGGVGKTRLALESAAAAAEVFADGVAFVPLAPVGDPELVLPTVAKALGVREAVGSPLREAVVAHLADRRLLLLLDNFEQVVAAAGLVADLLEAAAGLTVLVTSRVALRLRGERQVAVSPLALPESREEATLEGLRHNPAVALFVERSQGARPGFALGADNAAAVAQICRRLDGLPLAIELAAARSRLLDPRAMLRRLEKRLPLLTGGPRDLPQRQQTLRDTIAWSHDLLGAAEQRLFRRLAVFRGGWAESAAAEVCDLDDLAESDFIDALTGLVDSSVVRIREDADPPRFVMLATVREFAGERLGDSGEATRVRTRHAQYFLRLAEAAAAELTGPQEAAWFSELEVEHDNLRAALAWLSDSGERPDGLRLASALGRFWRVHGHLSEGTAWLGLLLEATAGEAPTVARAKALIAAGWLARDQGDYGGARAMFRESLALAETLGDGGTQAWSLVNLGFVARYEGDYGEARTLLERSLAPARAAGEKVALAAALGNLGLVARDQGDYAEAARQLEESLTWARAVGDSLGIAWPLTNLGLVACYRGDHPAARRYLEEALAIWRALGDRQNIANALNNLGLVATAEGAFDEARERFAESLDLHRRAGDRRGLCFVLEALALLAIEQGEAARGLRLAAAAAAQRQALGAASPPGWAAQREAKLAAARAALAEATAAWDEGVAMDLDAALAYALADDDAPPAESTG